MYSFHWKVLLQFSFPSEQQAKPCLCLTNWGEMPPEKPAWTALRSHAVVFHWLGHWSSWNLNTQYQTFFIERIFTCHSKKATVIKWMMSEFYLAASVSGSWYCWRWIAVTQSATLDSHDSSPLSAFHLFRVAAVFAGTGGGRGRESARTVRLSSPYNIAPKRFSYSKLNAMCLRFVCCRLCFVRQKCATFDRC